jgi:hypothetical protein
MSNACLQEGMALFGLLRFLAENPSEENFARVFPSATVVITPQQFMTTVITRGENMDDRTWEFFQRFLEDLYQGRAGKLSCWKKVMIDGV